MANPAQPSVLSRFCLGLFITTTMILQENVEKKKGMLFKQTGILSY